MRPFEKYVETYALICVTDGSYGVVLKKETLDEAVKKVLKKGRILESKKGIFYRLDVDGVEVEIFKKTRKMFIFALEGREKIEDFLDKLFSD